MQRAAQLFDHFLLLLQRVLQLLQLLQLLLAILFEVQQKP